MEGQLKLNTALDVADSVWSSRQLITNKLVFENVNDVGVYLHIERGSEIRSQVVTQDAGVNRAIEDVS